MNFETSTQQTEKVSKHRLEGLYIVQAKSNDFLTTINISPGNSVYGEKLFNDNGTELRAWNPYRSKLAASIFGGIENININSSSKILYLGAGTGETVSHISDIVGAEGIVYCVEFSKKKISVLEKLSETRTNIVPIGGDARKPDNYEINIEEVDCICVDVDQPDQARILSLNAQKFLKRGGSFLIFVNAPCIDSTIKPHEVYASELERLRKLDFKPKEQLTLEPFEKDHCVIVGEYLPK
jgi:rRNA 2'-O-methyltransferase fibrillarin